MFWGGEEIKKPPLGGFYLFYGFASSLSFVFIEVDFAESHGFGRDFHVLVLFDVFEGFFQAEKYGRSDVCFFIGTAGSHVCKFLGLADINHDVVLSGAFPDDLSGIHFGHLG